MRTILSILALCAPAVSQWNVVPSSVGDSDANSMALVAGLNISDRHQILIDERLLRPSLLNRSLRGISFRRDATAERAFAGGQADLTITISVAPHVALDASETMDENHDADVRNRVQVFGGRVVIPASAPPLGRTVSWSDPQDVVAISFQTPFAYTGGTLCIDIVGSPVVGRESRFWAVDALADTARGSVLAVGDGCGAFGGRLRTNAPYVTAGTGPGELVLGHSATFHGHGDVGQPGALLIGLQPTRIDLHGLGIGGPGCTLLVDPFVALATTYQDLSRYGIPGGEADVHVRIPTTDQLRSARFIGQFLQIGAPMFTSNALHCTIGGSRPNLGMATVLAPYDGRVRPTRGRVQTTRAPVVRFRS